MNISKYNFNSLACFESLVDAGCSPLEARVHANQLHEVVHNKDVDSQAYADLLIESGCPVKLAKVYASELLKFVDYIIKLAR